MHRCMQAFTHKITLNSGGERHKKGCNCKRSHCLKKYCECYQVGSSGHWRMHDWHMGRESVA